MRRPAGTGFCCPMISLTLETALGVRETGGVFFASGTFVFTSGTVVVAIRISLALKYLHYSRGSKAEAGESDFRPLSGRNLSCWMPGRRMTILSPATCQRVYNACVRPFLQVEDLWAESPALDGAELPNWLANRRGGL